MNYEFYDDDNFMNNIMPFNGQSIDEVDMFEAQNNFNPVNNYNPNYHGFDVLGGSTNPNYQDGKNNLNLFNPYEGYLKGNAFKDEYKPYKNYKVAKLNINSEKDEMLVNIGEYSFMMHDINLYLDVHPNDKEALNMFSEYRNKVNDLITKYERKYGPLCVKGIMSNNTPFAWENEKWPWGN